MKLPNTRPLCEVGEHNTKIVFFFLNLDMVRLDSTPEIFLAFDKLNEIEYDRWDF